eukprot:TRINITY_DN10276_c1_g1_i4.p1 TRINITY_DN10276_c1_g1~~TRINITY_DN10276_c1_g1_i4.p1  ORF type:complete len:122 (-),score=6.65 TRINITY_DN10276_c1_g1_i4:193-558(-)
MLLYIYLAWSFSCIWGPFDHLSEWTIQPPLHFMSLDPMGLHRSVGNGRLDQGSLILMYVCMYKAIKLVGHGSRDCDHQNDLNLISEVYPRGSFHHLLICGGPAASTLHCTVRVCIVAGRIL